MSTKVERELLLEVKQLLLNAHKKLQSALKLMGKTPKALHYIGVVIDIQRNVDGIYTTEKKIEEDKKLKVYVEPEEITAKGLFKGYRSTHKFSESILDFTSWVNEHDGKIKVAVKKEALKMFSKWVKQQEAKHVQPEPATKQQ